MDHKDEDSDKIIGFWLCEAHKLHVLFYHWSWYIFTKILQFYEDPICKLRFLFHISTKLNESDHAWGNVPDDPVRVSLGRRPRPILQYLFRTAHYYNFNTTIWKEVAIRINTRDEIENGFAKSFWVQFKSELREARAASIWEQFGRAFETNTNNLEWANFETNIPLNVIMERIDRIFPHYNINNSTIR